MSNLREALDALYKDNHRWSVRPCATCAAITAATGIAFGCDKKAHREPKKLAAAHTPVTRDRDDWCAKCGKMKCVCAIAKPASSLELAIAYESGRRVHYANPCNREDCAAVRAELDEVCALLRDKPPQPATAATFNRERILAMTNRMRKEAEAWQPSKMATALLFWADEIALLTSDHLGGPSQPSKGEEMAAGHGMGTTSPLAKPAEPGAPDSLIYVPGHFRCTECGFVLSKQTIHAPSGQIGITADNLITEPCPNDGTMMVKVTWREHSEGLDEMLTKEIQERVAREEAAAQPPAPTAATPRDMQKLALRANDLIQEHTVAGPETKEYVPNTEVACKCGAKFTAVNRDALTIMFVNHVVMEALLLAAPPTAPWELLEKAAQIAEMCVGWYEGRGDEVGKLAADEIRAFASKLSKTPPTAPEGPSERQIQGGFVEWWNKQPGAPSKPMYARLIEAFYAGAALARGAASKPTHEQPEDK